jgi:methanol metabolism-related c-type cytochrome
MTNQIERGPMAVIAKDMQTGANYVGRVVTAFVFATLERLPAGRNLAIIGAAAFAFMAALICSDAAPADPPGDPATVKNEDGKYFDSQGNPTYSIKPDGTVDWYTYSGFIRYSSECLRCHGPDGLGSSYAPALVDSLKASSYSDFFGVVASGKRDVTAAQDLVMPALGTDTNVMCYIDNIYVYLRARANGALGRGRPTKHDDKPEAAKNWENTCMGPE